MKSLVILKGVSKFHKRSWIDKERLGNYFIDIDTVRKLYSSPELVAKDFPVLNKSFGDTVYHRFLEAICLRMSRGCLIVIDPDMERCDVFETLAFIHGYKVFYVYQEPPQDYLKKPRKYNVSYYPLKKRSEMERDVQAIKSFDKTGKILINSFNELRNFWLNEASKDQIFPADGKILLVSDLHSNASLYKKLPDFKKYDRVIFFGDYIDGPEEGGSRKLVDKVVKSKSTKVTWLEGNHELRLRRYLGYLMLKEFGKKGLADLLYSTLPEDFLKTTAGEFKNLSGTQAKAYLEKLNQKLKMFVILGGKFICTHSGLRFREQLDPRFIGNVVYGNRDMGKYDREFSSGHESLGLWSIHAHCKYFDSWEALRYDRVVNLDPPSENEVVYGELYKDQVKICLIEKSQSK